VEQPVTLQSAASGTGEDWAMLGEQIGEERGKITGRRVLKSEGQGLKVEVSFQASGRFLGSEAFDMGTYWSEVQPNGMLYGEGQGIIRTANGEMVQWTGAGRGQFTAQGGVSFRGAVYYQTASESLARLNGVAIVYEHESDRDDNLTTRYWEWK
jgi:hypothetical protein